MSEKPDILTVAREALAECNRDWHGKQPCPATRCRLAQAVIRLSARVQRAALEARIEQAFEDGQLALRVQDEDLPNDDVHCPDEVTRRIQHEVIPALRAQLAALDGKDLGGT